MPECDLKWLDQLRLNQTEVRPQAYACHCYVMYTHYCLYSTEKLKNCFYGSDSAFCASISWHHITQRDHSSEDTNIWRQLCVQPRGDLEGQSLADLAVPSLYVVCIFFSSSSNHLDSPLSPNFFQLHVVPLYFNVLLYCPHHYFSGFISLANDLRSNFLSCLSVATFSGSRLGTDFKNHVIGHTSPI